MKNNFELKNMNILLPWYISGPLIGLTVPLLLIVNEKQFGTSSSFRFIGSKLFKKTKYFIYKNEIDAWQFHFAIGLVISSIIIPTLIDIENISKIEENSTYGLINKKIYDFSNIFIFFIGGMFIGYGSRYANGCTAGHCIMGISQFSLSSLISTVSFFIGGLFVSHIIIPIIFIK